MSEIEYLSREYEKLPEGTHSAVIESVTEGLKRNTKYGEKDALRIRFETEQLGQDGEKLSAILHCNRTIGKGSRLGQLIKQLTGKEPKPGQRFDPQSLVGMKVSIAIEHHEVDGVVYADVVYVSRRAAAGFVSSSKPTPSVPVEITDRVIQFPTDNA